MYKGRSSENVTKSLARQEFQVATADRGGGGGGGCRQLQKSGNNRFGGWSGCRMGKFLTAVPSLCPVPHAHALDWSPELWHLTYAAPIC